MYDLRESRSVVRLVDGPGAARVTPQIIKGSADCPSRSLVTVVRQAVGCHVSGDDDSIAGAEDEE